MRLELHQLGLERGRILALHYHARNTLAVLLHNDYVDEATTILRSHSVTSIKDFNPLHPLLFIILPFKTRM
ncbi:hypothetical protein A0J61_07591 [Choanephora cucurbitarum]|uniref:Uncharacterized protein n=1 Tax=Choanephora cucurbitarum TaxID=101091 RepID=A0A1C7N5F9_9FUNG|nr:hypothetical protein A0J61_07591 [Choanephora cucurbitarum]